MVEKKVRYVITGVGDLVGDAIDCPACRQKTPKLNVFCPNCQYDMTCDHDWTPSNYIDDNRGEPFWFDDEVIGVRVFCTKCKRPGVEMWIYSHTRPSK